MTDPTLLEHFAVYAACERARTLPGEVIHHAKRALIDWHAALLAGSVQKPATLLQKAIAEELDHGHSELADGRLASPRAAALINATAAHTEEVDDIYREAIYHPGAPTIAAALATAQARDASGVDLLRSIVVGYEISTRVGAAIAQAHCKYWHATGTVGTLGAAAAAASALDLSEVQIMHALANAASLAAGLQQAFRSESMTKPLHAGHAADVGVMTALGAMHGLVGARDIVDGEVGFGRAMGGDPDWNAAISDLGAVYKTTRITFKNHCCCGHAFAPLDAIVKLREDHALAPDHIDKVDVYAYQVAVDVIGSHNARVPSEARFSMPYVAARALVHGSVRLDAFTPAALSDSAVREMMPRISMHVDPALNAAFPGRRSARVVITCKDGRILEHYQPTRIGDPEQPLSDESLSHKFFELTAPVVGLERARGLLDRLWSVDSLASVRGLFPGRGTAASTHGREFR